MSFLTDLDIHMNPNRDICLFIHYIYYITATATVCMPVQDAGIHLFYLRVTRNYNFLYQKSKNIYYPFDTFQY